MPACASPQRSFMFWSKSRELREPGGTFWKLRPASGMRCTSCGQGRSRRSSLAPAGLHTGGSRPQGPTAPLLLPRQGDGADPTCSPLGAPGPPSPQGGWSQTSSFRPAVWGAQHHGESSRLGAVHVGGQGRGAGTGGGTGCGGGGRTSSRAEMVEAGVVGTLLREGLRAGPGEPSESPSPATSWISRARMATSFTSVWLSLQPAGEKAGPAGSSWPGSSAGEVGSGSLTEPPGPTSPLRRRQESLSRGKCSVRGSGQGVRPPAWPKLCLTSRQQCPMDRAPWEAQGSEAPRGGPGLGLGRKGDGGTLRPQGRPHLPVATRG